MSGGALNVLGTPLIACSFDPLTGWMRDGCCHTDLFDAGSHVVCAKVTVEFLNFQMERGNDLITARPERFGRNGLSYRDIEWLADFVERLGPEQVLHRLTGDADEDSLLAPLPRFDKSRVRSGLARELERRGTRQSSAL